MLTTCRDLMATLQVYMFSIINDIMKEHKYEKHYQKLNITSKNVQSLSSEVTLS